jgi:hypothetical protein
MLIDTRAVGFTPTEAEVRQVEASIESSLGFAARHVSRVSVELEQAVAGDGVLIRCRLAVSPRRLGRNITAESQDTSLALAVGAAAASVRHSVLREAGHLVRPDRRNQRRWPAFARGRVKARSKDPTTTRGAR